MQNALTRRWLPAAMTLLVLTGIATAQDQPAGEPPTGAPGESMPEVGSVLDAIEKATASQVDDGGASWSAPVKLAVVFMGLAVLPSLLVMMTSFTRIVIVLSFVRRALSTQTIPPNIAIIGLALFLTLFTMSRTFGLINQQALEPYLQDQISFQDACSVGNEQLKGFMVRQTRPGDLKLFVDMAGLSDPETPSDVPAHVIIPAFAISEFRRAFEMGCLLFIPFLLVDLVIASILLSAGMMMLPPAMISLPFKLILFVLVDGWQMLAETLVRSFQ
jgi:flagellar biosynthesis protein FliP